MLSRRGCMNIFIAGATGAVGRALIPRLIDRGHTVTGTTRSPVKAELLRSLGATPVVVDGLDRDALLNAIKAVEPDVIVHQMTALKGLQMKNIDKEFQLTNRLSCKAEMLRPNHSCWTAQQSPLPIIHHHRIVPFSGNCGTAFRPYDFAVAAIRHSSA